MDIVLETPTDPALILTWLTVDQQRDHMRVTHRMEDKLIQDMILDAFAFFDGPDGWLRRAVLPQQWSYYRTGFDTAFELPMSPVATVQDIRYRNDAGTWVLVPSTTYELVTGTTFGEVHLALNQTWPEVTARARAVQVRFTAGWAIDRVPRGVRRAIQLLAASLYQNREADMSDNRVSVVSRKIEYGLEKLAGRHRIRNDFVEVF